MTNDVFSKIGSGLTLSQKIERRIEEAIRQKKLLPGSKLPTEKELCAQFAVSRTALREALRRLSARGLIDIRKGSGMYISELKIEDAINSLHLFYDLRFNSDLILQRLECRRFQHLELARFGDLCDQHLGETFAQGGLPIGDVGRVAVKGRDEEGREIVVLGSEEAERGAECEEQSN